jgi:hypothetical protein
MKALLLTFICVYVRLLAFISAGATRCGRAHLAQASTSSLSPHSPDDGIIWSNLAAIQI